MKFYIVLFFVVIYNRSSSASFCKSSTKLWSCTNGIATFNEAIFEKVRIVQEQLILEGPTSTLTSHMSSFFGVFKPST